MKSNHYTPKHNTIIAHTSKGSPLELALDAVMPLPDLPINAIVARGNLFVDIECDDIEYTLTDKDIVRLTRSLASPAYQMPSGLTREQRRELIGAAANVKLEKES